MEIREGVWLYQNYLSVDDRAALLADVEAVCKVVAPQHMVTSRGFKMGVQTTSCGVVGWVSDRRGYRYSSVDLVSGKSWPGMPRSFSRLASAAASEAGFSRFTPDTCLMNRYEPGVQMGAHQDRDECDFSQPVVSVSLGIAARFFIVGESRTGKSQAVDLFDGDVLVFGGVARKHYHGVRKLKSAIHPELGAVRWNLTFRKAL